MTSRSAWSDFISRLVAYMLPVTYFLVTVSFYLRTYDSAQVKITLAQVGCSLTAVLWVVQLILEKRAPFRREDLVLAAPFIAVLASGLFSWAHSCFPGGSADEGLRRALYSFMGFIAFSEFRGLDRQRRLMRWLLAAFAVVVFYGFVQYLDTRLFPPGAGMGVDPFIWRQAFGARVFSSFGNPNFYGNFLVIITPILLTLYLKEGGRAFRPYLLLPLLAAVVVLGDKLWMGLFGGIDGAYRMEASIVLVALALGAAALIWWKMPSGKAAGMLLFFGVMFVTLYATETKGAWVGFVGAIVGSAILAGLYLMGAGGRRVTRRLLVAAAVTGVLGMGVVGYYARQRIQSVSFRVFTWISTWEMIRVHPVIGTGIGTFKWSYPAYRRPEIILLEGKSNTETDHAEEEYLEIWSDEGIIGIGLFLWMVLTVSTAGLKTLGALTAGRVAPEESDRDRVYALAAYLGAWWAALLHWCMDVSVRFVSSGVYSLLLPSLVAGLSRPEGLEPRQDAPSPLDRSVRTTAALFWTAIFFALPRYYNSPLLPQIWPALAMGAALWVLGELLEVRLSPPAPEIPLPSLKESHPSLLQAAAAASLLVGWGWAFTVFQGYFKADLDHNVAIFFSKGGVWAKGPEFDKLAASIPPEMQEEYARVGGALEHYQEVVRQNPAFPMAGYFIGNVFSDWGSVFYAHSQEARSQGRTTEADMLLASARGAWDKSLAAYDKVKAFAPNYVQTHHQVGTLYMKRMEMENALGHPDEARKDGDLALKNLGLYRTLDPVFPQNFYRIAQVLVSRGDYDGAEAAYRDALTYNSDNVVHRVYHDRNEETYVALGRLLMEEMDKSPHRKAPSDLSNPLFFRAVEAFEAALKEGDALGDSADPRFAQDAHKGLGLLYLRAGDKARASDHWKQVMAANPRDPDLLRVTGRK